MPRDSQGNPHASFSRAKHYDGVQADKKAAGAGAGKMEHTMSPKKGVEGDDEKTSTDIKQHVEEHGPAHEVHYHHDEQTDKHHVHSVHGHEADESGHHHSVHDTKEAAHEHIGHAMDVGADDEDKTVEDEENAEMASAGGGDMGKTGSGIPGMA